MISNFKKQEYLEQIALLSSAIELGKAKGEDLEGYVKELEKLKQEIKSQNDITLEETMDHKPRLDSVGVIEMQLK